MWIYIELEDIFIFYLNIGQKRPWRRSERATTEIDKFVYSLNMNEFAISSVLEDIR